MAFQLKVWAVCIGFLSVSSAFAQTTVGSTLDEKIDYVRRLPTEVSTEDRLAACQQIIDAFPEDPRRSEVMMICGHLLVATDKGRGLEWFRLAMKAASVESKTWFDSRFHLLGRIEPNSPEAEQIVDEIVVSCDRNSIHAAKAISIRLQGRIKALDLVGADKAGRELLHWYRTHTTVDGVEKSDVDRQITGSANLLLEMYVRLPASKEDRLKRIDEFQNEFGHISWIPHSCELARGRLRDRPDSDGGQAIAEAPIVVNKPVSSVAGHWLVLANVAAIGTICVVWMRIRQAQTN